VGGVSRDLTVIGLDGRPLGAAASAALTRATLVVGGRRNLDEVEIGLAARVLELGPIEKALAALLEYDEPAVVLASGDPGFFGIVRALCEAGLEPRVLPGASSVARAFAAVGLSWDDALVVSAHGRPLGPVVAACRAHPTVAVLTAPGAGPAELGAALTGSARRLVVATALGTPREEIADVTPEQAAVATWPDPTVVLVLDRQHQAERGWIAGGTTVPDGWALPESAFDHRDSMVTKSEVRALVLARLAPRTGAVVWDLGAGSGSVAVECARFRADVVAVERDPEQCRRIVANAARHRVSVDVVEGELPGALTRLRAPDAVFVGGGGPRVLEAALKAQPRRAVAAVAAVERAGAMLEVLDRQGFSAQGTQLSAARLAPLPDGGHRLAATNPVFVLWGERP
jgi:precorrin-6Y C5,15-methyltransferase (decarboxylating)